MSLGRVLLLGTVAIGGSYAAMKPEMRQNVKRFVALRLRKLSNALDPQGPPPMWNDKEESTDAPSEEQEVTPAPEEVPEEDSDEDRTIQGFKVKK